MRRFSATEAKQNFSALLDAAQAEPVTVRRQNRDVAVVMSPREYDRIRSANIQELEALCDRIGARAAAAGMTEEVLTDLLADET